MATMRVLLPIALVLAAGCRNGEEPGDTNVDTRTFSLQFEVSQDSVMGGQGAAIALTVVDQDGVAADAELSLTSDREDALQWGISEIVPRIAGDHTITATALVEGQTVTASDTLEVTAAEAAIVDLNLDDYQISAGDELAWSVEAMDAYGNPVDAAEVTVEILEDTGDATLGTGTVTSTVPGDYVVEARLGDAADAEVFFVVAGPAVGIDLTLSNTQLAARESASAFVEMWDDYGNEASDPYTLTVDNPDATISGRNITFWEEGWYTVTATIDGTSISDAEGPFLIDGSGPVITLATPDRGHWELSNTVTVAGTAIDTWQSVAAVDVNGTAATVASDGSFSSDVPVGWGINVISTTAWDDGGNVSNDTRAALAGDFIGYGESSDDGLVVRLNEGPGGLDAIEDLALGLVSDLDLGALLPSGAIFSDSSQSCLPWWLGGGCVTWYSIDLYVTNPTFNSLDVVLDPRSNNRLFTRLDVNGVSVDWNANGTLVGAGVSGSGDITASRIRADMMLRPTIVNDAIDVNVLSLTASTQNFDFTLNGTFGDILEFFGADQLVANLIEDALIGVVEDELAAELEPLLEDALNDLLTSFSFDIEGNTYDIELEPTSIAADDAGLTLGLGTAVYVQNWLSPRTGQGVLAADYTQPTYPNSPGAGVALSIDFVNQLFYALWGGGLLNLDVPSTDLGLDPSDIDFILPGVTDLSIAVDPLLPPVVVPGTGAQEADLQLGDLRLTLYDGDSSTGTVLMDVYVSGTAELDVGTNGGTALTAGLGEMDLYYDVVFPQASLAASDTEDFLSLLVPLLLPSLTDAIGEIEIPSIEGFVIDGATLGPAGPEDGYLLMTGDLVPE